MTNYDARHETDGDGGMWLVRLPNGGVRAVTLAQLDEAYQRDLISGDTEVLEDGATEWRTLSDLINDDELTPAYPTTVYTVHRDAQGMTRYATSGQVGPGHAPETGAVPAYPPPQTVPAYPLAQRAIPAPSNAAHDAAGGQVVPRGNSPLLATQAYPPAAHALTAQPSATQAFAQGLAPYSGQTLLGRGYPAAAPSGGRVAQAYPETDLPLVQAAPSYPPANRAAPAPAYASASPVASAYPPAVNARPVASAYPPAVNARPVASAYPPAVNARPVASAYPPAVNARPAASAYPPAVQSAAAQAAPSYPPVNRAAPAPAYASASPVASAYPPAVQAARSYPSVHRPETYPAARQTATAYPLSSHPAAAYVPSSGQAHASAPQQQSPGLHPAQQRAVSGSAVPPTSAMPGTRALGVQRADLAVPNNAGIGVGTIGPRSTAPVASDIYDLDVEFGAAAFKRKNRRALFVAAGVVAAAAIGISVASSQSSSEAGNSVAATKVQPAPPAPPAPAKAMPPEPSEVEKQKTTEDAGTGAATSTGSKLSEDMKRALAEADKHREKPKSERKRAKPRAVAAPPAEAPAKEAPAKEAPAKETPVFTSEADEHDPLNGDL